MGPLPFQRKRQVILRSSASRMPSARRVTNPELNPSPRQPWHCKEPGLGSGLGSESPPRHAFPLPPQGAIRLCHLIYRLVSSPEKWK